MSAFGKRSTWVKSDTGLTGDSEPVEKGDKGLWFKEALQAEREYGKCAAVVQVQRVKPKALLKG